MRIVLDPKQLEAIKEMLNRVMNVAERIVTEMTLPPKTAPLVIGQPD